MTDIALPGADLVEEGLADIRAGNADTIAALLVAIGAPRLRRLGVTIPELAPRQQSAELTLYLRLQKVAEDDAHARYNALLRRLISYERARELDVERLRRRGG